MQPGLFSGYNTISCIEVTLFCLSHLLQRPTLQAVIPRISVRTCCNIFYYTTQSTLLLWSLVVTYYFKILSRLCSSWLKTIFRKQFTHTFATYKHIKFNSHTYKHLMLNTMIARIYFSWMCIVQIARSLSTTAGECDVTTRSLRYCLLRHIRNLYLKYVVPYYHVITIRYENEYEILRILHVLP